MVRLRRSVSSCLNLFPAWGRPTRGKRAAAVRLFNPFEGEFAVLGGQGKSQPLAGHAVKNQPWPGGRSDSCSAISNCEARADRQGGKLVDRVAASAPVGELLVIEVLGHMRMPFAEDRPDHGSGIKLTAIGSRRHVYCASRARPHLPRKRNPRRGYRGVHERTDRHWGDPVAANTMNPDYIFICIIVKSLARLIV